MCTLPPHTNWHAVEPKIQLVPSVFGCRGGQLDDVPFSMGQFSCQLVFMRTNRTNWQLLSIYFGKYSMVGLTGIYLMGMSSGYIHWVCPIGMPVGMFNGSIGPELKSL